MPTSSVRGIISSSNTKFLKFFELVQNEAAARNKVFFIAGCECHDQELDDLYLSAMCGWLVPADQADEFEATWMLGSDTWEDTLWGSHWSDDFFVFEDFDVKRDGTIVIRFRKWPDEGDPYNV